MNKTALWITGGVLVIAALIIGWILISPLFIDDVVNEELPFKKTSKETNTNKQINTTIKLNETKKETKKEGPTTSHMGRFIDADDFHKVSGIATVHEQEGTRYLRFEEFKATNGPDLKVYLATDNEATEYVSLGTLKGNIGNQNYEIPAEADLTKHNKVLIWCRAFSTLFGSAELEADSQ